MDGNGMIEGFEEEEPKNDGVVEVVNEEPMVNYGHLNGNRVIEGFDNYGHLNGNGLIEGFDNYGHPNGNGVIDGFQNEQQDGEPVLKYGHLNGNGVIEGFEREQRVPKYRKLSVSVAPEINSSLIGGVFEKEKRTPKANQLYQNSDFILIGKDKFPPPEFSNSGSKKKLRTNGKINSFLERRYSHAFKKCSTLLSKLMKHKFGWVFNKPVDVKALGLHDYYSIIRHPMDLGTVKSRLNKNWYKTPAEFAEDVRLTFRNAMTYNPKGQDVHIMAQQLSQIFEEQWPAIEAEYAYVPYPPTPVPRRPMPFDGRMLERSDSTVYPVEAKTKPVNYPAPIVHHIVRPTVVRQPKPKAKDLYKREMTAEEKQKLNGHLQALPAEKLDGVVQIIRKRNSVLCPQEDEIEIDIDLLDTETLWELDRFVTNYKKSLSKHKRRAELAMLAKAKAERERGQERVMELGIVGEPIGNTTGGKGVASSLQIGGENKREDSSGSSSSSSSSSDSGSSSSDSDSDSSSESDTGH
ncbi:uncharacterized protein A4U43_C05F17240 [Asparagus officinalis]|uniref:Bromo domain-containing protein n=1 Tax=Asparagus officinalis TaxID=4686 RepID=A0A5P1ETA5_ASPOF|nr:transcription factor GTE4-like [Asparagus officinalis]ONK68903.1 uncharacterized protein A4U43_C05F17240 [Asparagus officinalis]